MPVQTPHVIRNLDPATGELIGSVPCADVDAVRLAVARARDAQSAWAQLGIEGRIERLEAVAAHMETGDALEQLGALITQEMGKPLADARREAASTPASIRNHFEACRKALAPVTTREGDTLTCVSREALGVVAAITPWNFPVGMARSIIVPALIAGNTVVCKPSELVPLCGAALHELFAAELPEGVLTLVQGDESTGKALVAANVDMVGFVGSVSAGRHIMSACSVGLKRLVLELGGKDPMIVCADADLEAAASYAVRESMRNSGQVCCSVERIYVERAVTERFTELVVEKTRELVMGDGREEVFMGPMASESQRSNVLEQLADARAKGATIQLGGEAGPGEGFYMLPTVVTDVDESMDLMTEETFGPVASLRTVDNAEQAVELANDSPFGLGASVWVGDTDRGRQLAARLESGQVGVNRGIGGVGDPPWAGVKQSGFGFLGSADGYRQFSRPLSISWNESADA